MKYSEVYSLIKSGDIIAFRGHGVQSWIIRKWTKSNYAHVGIAWVVGNRVLIIESRPRCGGVTVDRLLAHALRDKPTLVITETIWDDKYENRALEKLGQPYSRFKAICAGLGIELHGRGFECAEFASYVLNIPIEDNAVPDHIVHNFERYGTYIIE